VADLNADGADAVVEAIRAAGGTAVGVTGDLADQSVVDEVVKTAVDAFGGLHGSAAAPLVPRTRGRSMASSV